MVVNVPWRMPDGNAVVAAVGRNVTNRPVIYQRAFVRHTRRAGRRRVAQQLRAMPRRAAGWRDFEQMRSRDRRFERLVELADQRIASDARMVIRFVSASTRSRQTAINHCNLKRNLNEGPVSGRGCGAVSVRHWVLSPGKLLSRYRQQAAGMPIEAITKTSAGTAANGRYRE